MSDIVERLRVLGAGLGSFGSIEREAANAIADLRARLAAAERERDEASRRAKYGLGKVNPEQSWSDLVEELRRERDEARAENEMHRTKRGYRVGFLAGSAQSETALTRARAEGRIEGLIAAKGPKYYSGYLPPGGRFVDIDAMIAAARAELAGMKEG